MLACLYRYLSFKVCIMRKALKFFAPCLNVFEASWFAWKGQFTLETGIDLFLVKAGITWNFQVHEPFEPICLNEKLAQTKDYCCMCDGENWGEAYVKVKSQESLDACCATVYMQWSLLHYPIIVSSTLLFIWLSMPARLHSQDDSQQYVLPTSHFV